ncbi:DEAD/DEAH box helicase [Candidatus Dojkabacteria bacterium]|uniref:DEAD/DEAH box helicase n=1 Tax=Candidatus Dojkabacteria bacterium TaxID=2099670 RepID=A0A955ICC2_9BACT|nr:DEAD/DEAH box helicase [Candidatus Dojkabacteria bacterium]
MDNKKQTKGFDNKNRSNRKFNKGNSSSRNRQGGFSSGRSGNGSRGNNSSSRFSNNRGSSNRNSNRGFGRGRSNGRRGGGRNRQKSGVTIPIEKLINKRIESVEEVAYKPMFTVDDLPIDQQIKNNIAKKGFNNLTPIQDKAIPAIAVGQDVVGIADTGSGKTAAFLIPAIQKAMKNPEKKTLIVTPTRELALQINKEFRSLSLGTNIFSVVCIGGTDIKNQKFFLQKRHNFVIGTPGRLLDLINQKALKTKDFDTLVLDEVDRMLDMGFIDDVDKIIKSLPEYRQTLFFSATSSKQVETLMRKFLAVDFAKFSVKKRDTSKNVDQDIVPIQNLEQKVDKLLEILSKTEVEKTIIFVRTKRFADKLSNDLYKNGHKVATLHGDKSQSHRKRSLDQFKYNKVSILVATDVAARGLDIPDVTHVINYDVPENYDDYIHRIGRTGRADNTGYALTFVHASQVDRKMLEQLNANAA